MRVLPPCRGAVKIHRFLRVKAQPLVIASAVCIVMCTGAGGGRCWCSSAPLSPQEAEIDSIHQLVVGATENIKEGNEDIREAIKNNAGFRVWVLFFLVMCSFSLLFLDWYDS
ncbi:syntaxin 18 [Rhinolophus ferrumequinum]|uniref:Syntaxin 18 n=1 Tax=Rhinolophus ferrumequinum TaxID=59479 RepID=A0A7J7ZE52_RHIFE|nr:syntaxin 18 [Rhinolophus ferrumequinum]